MQIVRGTSLKILGLVTSDAGVYQCIASNSVASAQALAQLQVKSKGRLSIKTLQTLTRNTCPFKVCRPKITNNPLVSKL